VHNARGRSLDQALPLMAVAIPRVMTSGDRSRGLLLSLPGSAHGACTGAGREPFGNRRGL